MDERVQFFHDHVTAISIEHRGTLDATFKKITDIFCYNNWFSDSRDVMLCYVIWLFV